jgi:Coenzyme PQQ synthesis protein D (PqqD)
LNIDDGLLLQRDPAAKKATIGGALVIFSARAGAYFTLNETGSAIWDQLQLPIGVTQIRQRLAHDYELSPGALNRELDEFIERLIKNRLVDIVPATDRR